MNDVRPVRADDETERTDGPAVADFLAYRASLRRYFGRAIGDDEAEDYVQEVFARIFSTGTREKIQNPGGFLHRIASNLLTERYRRRATRRRHGMLVTLDEAAAVAAPDSESPERIVAAREELDRLEAALQAMPAARRKVFVLIRLEERSYRDVGHHAGYQRVLGLGTSRPCAGKSGEGGDRTMSDARPMRMPSDAVIGEAAMRYRIWREAPGDADREAAFPSLDRRRSRTRGRR